MRRPSWWTPGLEEAEQEARRLWGPNAVIWGEFGPGFVVIEQYGIAVFEDDEHRKLLWKEYGWDLPTALRNAQANHPPRK